MKFETVNEMIKYIVDNTDKTVVEKNKVPHINDKIWIHSEEGKIFLNGKGYFTRQQIKDRISPLFNHFKCTNCKEENNRGERCKLCVEVQNSIKNL